MPEHGLPLTDEELFALKRVVNRALSVITANKVLAETWGFYLFDQALNGEPELRNKVAAIFISGMLDTLEQRITKRLATARFTAQLHSYKNLNAWCDRVDEFRSSVAQLLSLYTYEEYVFLQFMRNQFVHG